VRARWSALGHGLGKGRNPELLSSASGDGVFQQGGCSFFLVFAGRGAADGQDPEAAAIEVVPVREPLASIGAVRHDLVAPAFFAAFRAFITFQKQDFLFVGFFFLQEKAGIWPDREFPLFSGLWVFYNYAVVQDEAALLVFFVFIKPAGKHNVSNLAQCQFKAGADVRDVEFVVQVVDLHFGHGRVVALVDKISASPVKKIDGS